MIINVKLSDWIFKVLVIEIKIGISNVVLVVFEVNLVKKIMKVVIIKLMM